MPQRNPRDLLIPGIIIFTGVVLRFFNLPDVPFTHDELSALSRIRFSSIQELIQKGVVVDAHPAGIQLFLYYWTDLVGNREIWVKLPFTLMGIGSIGLTYIIGKKWFGLFCGWSSAALVATLQFTVMYSQIARPYASGLFFTLLLVGFWTLYLKRQDQWNWPLVGLIISAILCFYNHYFSSLMAAIVYFSGYFFINRKKLLPYLSAGLVIILSFWPHLSITRIQLGHKGLSWLAQPEWSFILDHLYFVFHFDPVIIGLTLFICLWGWVRHLQTDNRPVRMIKVRLLFLAWFLIPIIFGLIYSTTVMPILQHSLLIFSLPFLFIVIFSFRPRVSYSLQFATITILLVTNTLSLLYTRKYYRQIEYQPFNRIPHLIEKHQKEEGIDKTTIFLGKNPAYLGYYFDKYGLDIKFHSAFNGALSAKEMLAILQEEDPEFVVAGGLEMDYLALLRDKYPTIVDHEEGYNYEYYALAKGVSARTPEDLIFESVIGEKPVAGAWTNFSKGKPDTATNRIYYTLSDTIEFGATFTANMDELINTRHAFIESDVDFRSGADTRVQIVCEIMRKDQTKVWRNAYLANYQEQGETDKWNTAYFGLRLSHVFRSLSDASDSILKVYLWNPEGNEIMYRNFTLTMREGNPWVYGLVEPLDE
ncbi:MAG: glycosyltransferase family 39 protein [Saprospiraceae bacterium]|nr:glycosyltransferase family 39 protein [Saprospiraceae bacterium]